MKNVVVIMPFGEGWSDRVWNGLRELAVKNTSKDISISRVDMYATAEELLGERIEKLNRAADIVIADLTEANANVLIEIGIALALRTPLFLISQEREWVPTHLKGRIVEYYDPNDDNSLRRLVDILLLRIHERLQLEKDHEGKRLREPVYKVECSMNRETANLQKYFKEAKTRIDILTTNLSFLFDAYGEGADRYIDDIEAALNRRGSNVLVRLLTLNPDSHFVQERGNQLSFKSFAFRNMLLDSLRFARQVAEKYAKKQIQIRIFDDFPNQITFRIDSTIFHCVVAQPLQSRNYLTIKLDRRQPGVHAAFVTHFETVWGAAVESES